MSGNFCMYAIPSQIPHFSFSRCIPTVIYFNQAKFKKKTPSLRGPAICPQKHVQVLLIAT